MSQYFPKLFRMHFFLLDFGKIFISGKIFMLTLLFTRHSFWDGWRDKEGVELLHIIMSLSGINCSDSLNPNVCHMTQPLSSSGSKTHKNACSLHMSLEYTFEKKSVCVWGRVVVRLHLYVSVFISVTKTWCSCMVHPSISKALLINSIQSVFYKNWSKKLSL